MKLALDLGTRTGFAYGNAGAVVSGVWDFRTSRHEGAGMRYLRFAKALGDLHRSHGIDEAAFEEVRRHRGTTAAHVYGGFMGTLLAFCDDNGVPYRSVPVGEIKKHWTGKGNADKEAMVREAERRGHTPADDNEADALALFSLMETQGMT